MFDNQLLSVIKEKRCCGCEACRQSCPIDSIILEADSFGFMYPVIDEQTCINCGLCEKVCPVLNRVKKGNPIKQYAAFSYNDEVRLRSSSGGIFTQLAEEIINTKGGVVFGVEFDENWDVRHSFCEKTEDIGRFQGSKYVQSQIKDSYIKVRGFLNDGRFVLFSGTPCQISGLKLFLRKEYLNLITVEVICHGVPSPKVWKDYLASLGDANTISGFNFRDKSKFGWRRYSYKLTRNNGMSQYFEYGNNAYSEAFLNNLTLRPSCFNCPSKLSNSRADITLGDYWGIEHVHQDLDDDKGCSIVILHTEKGQSLFERISCVVRETELDNVITYNPSLVESSSRPQKYDVFWTLYQRKGFGSLSHFVSREQSLIKRTILSLRTIFSPIYHLLCQR